MAPRTFSGNCTRVRAQRGRQRVAGLHVLPGQPLVDADSHRLLPLELWHLGEKAHRCGERQQHFGRSSVSVSGLIPG